MGFNSGFKGLMCFDGDDGGNSNNNNNNNNKLLESEFRQRKN